MKEINNYGIVSESLKLTVIGPIVPFGAVVIYAVSG